MSTKLTDLLAQKEREIKEIKEMISLLCKFREVIVNKEEGIFLYFNEIEDIIFDFISQKTS